MRALSYIGTEKITFPLKPDGETDRRTDISVYRVVSLLKMHIALFYESSAYKRLMVVSLRGGRRFMKQPFIIAIRIICTCPI